MRCPVFWAINTNYADMLGFPGLGIWIPPPRCVCMLSLCCVGFLWVFWFSPHSPNTQGWNHSACCVFRMRHNPHAAVLGQMWTLLGKHTKLHMSELGNTVRVYRHICCIHSTVVIDKRQVYDVNTRRTSALGYSWRELGGLEMRRRLDRSWQYLPPKRHALWPWEELPWLVQNAWNQRTREPDTEAGNNKSKGKTDVAHRTGESRQEQTKQSRPRKDGGGN